MGISKALYAYPWPFVKSVTWLLADNIIEQDKSATQKASDTFRSGADDTQNEGQGILGSAQETLGSVAGTASDKVKGAGESLSYLNWWHRC